MGKSLEFLRVECRLPVEFHRELKTKLRDARMPMNAVLVALLDAYLRGDVAIERRRPVSRFLAKPVTVRDAISGNLRAA